MQDTLLCEEPYEEMRNACAGGARGRNPKARSRTRRPRGSQALPRVADVSGARVASVAGVVSRPATALRCLNAPHPRPAPSPFSGRPGARQRAEDAGLAEALIGCYAREAELYRGLLNLATEQGARLERGEPVRAYVALFPRKDELLRAICAAERELEPLKRRWWADAVRPEARQRLNAILDGLLLTIEGIRAQEELNERLLMGRGMAAGYAVRQTRASGSPGRAEPPGARSASDGAAPRPVGCGG